MKKESLRTPTPDEIASSKLIPYCAARNPRYEIAMHNQVIAEYLEAVERQEITRLLISMPPRHSKTLSLQMFIEWYMGRHPEEEVIYCTYSGERAQDVGLAVKHGMMSEEFQYVFPGIMQSGTSTSKSKISIKNGGNLYFVGVNEALTGRGSNIFCIDDPCKGEKEAMSEAVTRDFRSWYSSVAYTRLMPKNAIIVCHTRWTTEDPMGWLTKEHGHENWVELRLPAIAEPNDILGRKVGDALWPSRYPVHVLNAIKLSMKSARRWNAIYQQRPVPEEGALVQHNWFSQKYYRFDGQYVYFRLPSNDFVQERVIRIVQSWDTAYKKEEINDPSVCITWAVLKTGYAILDVFVRKMEYPELKKMIVSQYDEYGPSAVLIEDRSSGQSLVQEFKHSPIPVIGVGVSKDKVIRLKDNTDLMEAGKLFLPERNLPWIESFIDELTTFPYGGNDDQVDSTSLFLTWIKTKKIFKKKKHRYYK